MSATSEITTTSASWIAVNGAGGSSHVLLQLKSDGPVLVQVATSAPANDSTGGIVLYGGALEELPLPGLGATDIVYLRSRDEGEPNLVAAYIVPA